jgi:hypothetical protein
LLPIFEDQHLLIKDILTGQYIGRMDEVVPILIES